MKRETAILAIMTLASCAGGDGGGSGGSPSSWTRVPGDVGWTVVHVPSTGADAEGVAVYLSWPAAPSGARYAEGAPVVVEVPGGKAQGNLPPAGRPGYADFGFVHVTLVFPGGTSGPIRSGGVYDYRGIACVRAVADVVRFACGLVATTEGKTIQDLVGYPVLTNDVGILAVSNGGNAATVALDLFGGEMPVAWYAGWENPSGDRYITGELGKAGDVNPFYVPYSGTVDYGTLAVAPTFLAPRPDPAGSGESLTGARVVFFDVDGNGVFTFSDLDGDGLYDPGEPTPDYPVEPWVARLSPTSPLRGLYSVEMTAALGTAPFPLASPAEAQSFWQDRDAKGHWTAAVAVMVLASQTDHGQGAPDHPHIMAQIEGWRTAGAGFVRLNPDSAYIAQMGGATSIDNAANQDYSWAGLLAGLEPDSLDSLLMPAAVEEMADRAHVGDYSANLDATLAY